MLRARDGQPCDLWWKQAVKGQGGHMPLHHIACAHSGLDCFLYGLSDEAKQAHREQLFAVSHEDLVDVSNR